jgi:hypothetical protein
LKHTLHLETATSIPTPTPANTFAVGQQIQHQRRSRGRDLRPGRVRQRPRNASLKVLVTVLYSSTTRRATKIIRVLKRMIDSAS